MIFNKARGARILNVYIDDSQSNLFLSCPLPCHQVRSVPVQLPAYLGKSLDYPDCVHNSAHVTDSVFVFPIPPPKRDAETLSPSETV